MRRSPGVGRELLYFQVLTLDIYHVHEKYVLDKSCSLSVYCLFGMFIQVLQSIYTVRIFLIQANSKVYYFSLVSGIG